MTNDLKTVGWFNTKTGKAAVIQWQSVSDRIGWRYKGQKRTYESYRNAFLKKFKNSLT